MKQKLSEGRVKGNLEKENLTQLYKINYLEKEKEWVDKIEIAILMEKDIPDGDNLEGAYRSIRFSNPVQLKGFIMGAIKAYFFFLKSRKEIIAENYNYKVKVFLEDVMQVIREVWR